MNQAVSIKNQGIKSVVGITSLIRYSLFVIRSQGGQALVTLLIFSATAIIITGAAVAVSIANSQATSTLALSQEVYGIAEAGAENAVLQLLRNQNFTGETLNINTGSYTTTVTGTSTKTITIVGQNSGIRRTIEVVGTFTNGQFAISSWKEI